jgi:hypothetical protein
MGGISFVEDLWILLFDINIKEQALHRMGLRIFIQHKVNLKIPNKIALTVQDGCLGFI